MKENMNNGKLSRIGGSMMDFKNGKVTIVGAGEIGSAAAYGMLIRKSASDIVLANRNAEKARVKAFDMSHCIPHIDGVSIKGGGLEESEDSQVLVLTVGVLPQKDGNRTDVLARNVKIYEELVPYLAELSPNAVMVAVTNPVDIMAMAACSFSGFPLERVIGTGTLLDTLRFRSFIGGAIGVSPWEVEAFVVGEHGESMVPVWSNVRVSGMELKKYVEEKGIFWDTSIEEEIIHKTRRAGWYIRLGNEHSRYAIAFSISLIVEAILEAKDKLLPVSVNQNGDYGLDGSFMSLPSKLGQNGVVETVTIGLLPEERDKLFRSSEIIMGNANAIKEYL